MADIHSGSGHQNLWRDQCEAHRSAKGQAGDHGELEDDRIAQRVKHRRGLVRAEPRVLRGKLPNDPPTLVVPEPACGRRRIRQEPKHRRTERNRREAFNEE